MSTDSPTPIADLSARSRKYVLLYTSSKESRSRKMHDGKSGKTKPSCTQNEKAKHILILTYSCGAQSVTNKHLTFHHLLFQKNKIFIKRRKEKHLASASSCHKKKRKVTGYVFANLLSAWLSVAKKLGLLCFFLGKGVLFILKSVYISTNFIWWSDKSHMSTKTLMHRLFS